MTAGSVNLRRYLTARRSGTPRESAAAMAGISLAEATLWDADEAKGELAWVEPISSLPPIQDATAGSGSSPAFPAGNREPGAGERTFVPDGRESPATTPKETETMARPRKVEQVEVITAPDFDLAVSIYRKDIKPAASKVGEHAQEMSEAYKAIKKRANIQPQAAKLAFRLDDMEESKRDDFLRSLNGLLKKLNIFMPVDLVDAAEGKGADGDEVIPAGSRRRPQLATVPAYNGDNGDLAGEPAVH